MANQWPEVTAPNGEKLNLLAELGHLDWQAQDTLATVLDWPGLAALRQTCKSGLGIADGLVHTLRLTFDSTSPNPGHGSTKWVDSKKSEQLQRAARCLALLPRMRNCANISLTFDGFQTASWLPDVTELLRSAMPHVANIYSASVQCMIPEGMNAYCYSPPQSVAGLACLDQRFLDLLAALPSLQRLELDTAWRMPVRGPAATAFFDALAPKLHALTFSGPVAMDSLARLTCLERLEVRSLDDVSEDTLGALATMDSLHSLVLRCAEVGRHSRAGSVSAAQLLNHLPPSLRNLRYGPAEVSLSRQRSTATVALGDRTTHLPHLLHAMHGLTPLAPCITTVRIDRLLATGALFLPPRPPTPAPGAGWFPLHGARGERVHIHVRHLLLAVWVLPSAAETAATLKRLGLSRVDTLSFSGGAIDDAQLVELAGLMAEEPSAAGQTGLGLVPHTLHVSSCMELTPAGVAAVLRALPSVRAVRLEGCPKLCSGAAAEALVEAIAAAGAGAGGGAGGAGVGAGDDGGSGDAPTGAAGQLPCVSVVVVLAEGGGAAFVRARVAQAVERCGLQGAVSMELVPPCGMVLPGGMAAAT